MSSTARLSIGGLAKATGVKVVTIRYYEQVGLLPVPSRTGRNYRTYDHVQLRRLLFVRRCRDLGFTLDQVRGLLRLSSQRNQECSEVCRITAQHLAEIEEKIADLTVLASELRRINSSCQGDRLIAGCRIVEALTPSGEFSKGSTLPRRRHPVEVPEKRRRGKLSA